MGPGGLAAVQGAVNLGTGLVNTGIQYFAQRGLMREQDRLNSIGHKMEQYRDAGVNPMFAVGDGQAQGSVGLGQAAPPSSQGAPDVISNYYRKQELGVAQEQASAATTTANANMLNAENRSRELDIYERELNEVKIPQLIINQYEADIKSAMTKSNIEVNDEQVKVLSKQFALLDAQINGYERYLKVAEKNADAAQKQAIAALRSADAAYQNALTNEYLSNYEASLKYSQQLLNEINTKQGQEILKMLPEKLQAEVKKLNAEGYYLNARGELCDKEGKLVDAKTVQLYVQTTREVIGAIGDGIGLAVDIGTGGVSHMMPGSYGYPSAPHAPIGFNATP